MTCLVRSGVQNGVADVQEMGYNELITHKASSKKLIVLPLLIEFPLK